MKRALLIITLFIITAPFVYAQEQPSFLLNFWKAKGAGYYTPQDNQILSGGCGSDPFAELKAYGCDTGRINCSPGYNKENGINPNFACRLAKYIKHLKSLGCSPKFTSAYRSEQHQRDICGAGKATGCAAPGRSCHGAGIAADLTGISPQTGCKAATPQVAISHGLIYGYSSDPNRIVRASGNNHIQCVEKKTTGCNASERSLCGKDTPKNDDTQQPPPQQQNQSPTAPYDQANKQAEQQAGQTPSPSGGGGGSPSSGGGAASSQNPTQTPQQQPIQQALQQSGTVSAVMPLLDASLTCSPEERVGSDPVTLQWECPQGSVPRIVANKTDTVQTSNTNLGTVSVSPLRSTAYALSCIKDTQLVAQGTCAVTVKQGVASKALLEITVSESEVQKGDSVEVRWSARNIRSGSCVVAGPGDFELHGSKGAAESDALMDAVNTFTLTCLNTAGQSIEKQTKVLIQKMQNRIQYKEQSSYLTNPLDDLH